VSLYILDGTRRPGTNISCVEFVQAGFYPSSCQPLTSPYTYGGRILAPGRHWCRVNSDRDPSLFLFVWRFRVGSFVHPNIPYTRPSPFESSRIVGDLFTCVPSFWPWCYSSIRSQNNTQSCPRFLCPPFRRTHHLLSHPISKSRSCHTWDPVRSFADCPNMLRGGVSGCSSHYSNAGIGEEEVNGLSSPIVRLDGCGGSKLGLWRKRWNVGLRRGLVDKVVEDGREVQLQSVRGTRPNWNGELCVVKPARRDAAVGLLHSRVVVCRVFHVAGRRPESDYTQQHLNGGTMYRGRRPSLNFLLE
ncbi:hypothetical protein FA13DRAFT_1474515, partial [Coprinellus micaceus]